MNIVRATAEDASVLTRIAHRAKRHWGYPTVEIESDPNAEGFYRRMGAHRVRTNVTVLEGQRRELPVLICEIEAWSSK